MSEVHKCRLPHADASGLHKLPPNAPCFTRLLRKLRKLTIVNPANFRCKVFFHNRSAIVAEQRRHIKSRYNYIIHPFSTFNVMLEVSFFLVWLAKMIYCPMFPNMMDLGPVRFMDSYIVSTIQNVLIITIFFVGYIDKYHKEVIIQHESILKKYVCTYFLFDIFTTEAFKKMVAIAVSLATPDLELRWRLTRAVLYMNVPCLYVRLYSILDYLDHICQMMTLRRKVRRGINYLVKTYLCIHFFCCLVYLVPQAVYHDNWPKDSWLVAANIQPDAKAPLYKIYGECMLMVICFFFGASEGKYNVNQTCEQICLCIITFLGRMYTLFLLADALRMFGIVGISEASYEKQLLQLKEYMMSNNLPPALRARMVKYYETKLQKRYFDEREILNSLSDNLRAELLLFSARKLLQKSDIFKYLPQTEVSTLISMMKPETFAPGDVIFKIDQNIDVVYFISNGSVAILSRSAHELCHLEDGDVFGLCMSVLNNRNYSAVVAETTELFVIKGMDLIAFLESYPRAAQYLRHVAHESLARYKKLEQNIKNQVDSCLEELRKGALLEKKRKRKVVGE